MTMATTNQCEYDDTDNNGTNESRTNLQELLSRLSLILAGLSSVHNNNNNKNKNNNNNDNPETAAEEKNTNNERDAILTQLFEGFDPETIFDTISPLLFSNSHTNNNTTTNNNNNNNANNNVEKDTISSEKQLCTCTLQSLIAIVSTQPARFTLPAITSIYNHVKKQQSNMMRIDYDENNIDSFNCNINISNELIDTIFHLVQHQSLQIANVASQTLILLASKVLLPSPSPYQRHVTSKIILLIHDYIQHLVFAMSNPRTACSSDVKNKDHKKTGGLVIGSNNSDNHREHERNTSILVIRNLTLLVDIVKTATTLTTTANAYSFLLLSTHYTNTSTTSSAATTNTRTVTILDPILNLFTLMQHDPLFIINMFEILEQMVSTTHATTTTTTTATTTKTTTSTKKMFSAWIQENLIAMLLSKVGFMLKKKNEDELGEYGFVLKCINDIDLFCYNSALSILSSSCCCTSGTSISTSNSSDDDGMKLTPSMMILIFKYILSSCINESHDEVEMIQFINSLTTFTIEDDCRSNDNRPNSSNFSTSSSSSISNERNERLNLVLKETDLIEFWFSMKRGSSKFKAATLCSIAAVIECKDCSSNSINNDSDGIEIMNTFVSNEMCMDMYTLIGEVNGNSTTTALLINYMKSAIIEIRLATYAIIKAMIVNRKSNRGIFLLISHGGFMELILSRNIEDVKESNELKYEIVKGILDSDVKALLNQPVVQLLERHVNQGPHYLQGVRGDMLVE